MRISDWSSDVCSSDLPRRGTASGCKRATMRRIRRRSSSRGRSVREWLASPRDGVAFVRVNPLDGEHTAADLAAVLPASPDGIMLPKAEGTANVQALQIGRVAGRE